LNNQNIPHTPVLLQEIIQAFSHCKDGYIIDCTAGFGGHSFNILNNNPNIKLIYNDQDIQALNFCENRLKPFENKTIKNFGNFSTVISKYSKLNITGILADIGVSSLQLDDLSRGFSFQSESLDMRMDKNSNLKASDIVNNYPQTKLEQILKEYGEIKEYKKIASLIIQNRPFKSAKELSLLLNKNLYNSGKLNPSTLTFQAIRIEVNSELEVLK
jgi:16S rRNA (cytosine1402-N4)-methyltransferase